tara:strand:- start:48 stop:341 length:294 start_codon:yes stop_codon:yes gene_type:complete
MEEQREYQNLAELVEAYNEGHVSGRAVCDKLTEVSRRLADLEQENKKLNSLRNVLIEHLDLDDYIADICQNCIYDYNLDEIVRDKVEDVLRDARIEI